MPHDVSLIAILAAGFGLALFFGYLAARMRMPPLVGYLVAGILIGPATPGFVADLGLASQLAEIGVMLLMFGVGLHFSLQDLVAVWRVAVPGAIVQIAAAVAMGAGIANQWGWDFGSALVFGLCLSVASTVVLLRALETKRLLDSINGRIAVGWLLVEDLIMVLILVLLPAVAGLLGGHGSTTGSALENLWPTVGLTIAKVMLFITLMLVAGQRVFPRILWLVANTGSRELFTLCVIAAAVGVAFGAAQLFDVSFALGAFFAGMMLRESEFSHRAAEESLPLRDAFAVLFFVSVGMLFDPAVILAEPAKLLSVAVIIMVGKTVAAMALVLAFRFPLNTALTVGVSLAQIGEFSFILAGLGVSLGLLPVAGQNLILGGALISIAANSLLFAAIEPLQQWIRKNSSIARRLEQRAGPLAELPPTTDPNQIKGHIIIVGYGRVGRRIASALDQEGIPHVVIEHGRDTVQQLRDRGVAAVSGDAAERAVLTQAHITNASMLVLATQDTIDAGKIIKAARSLNPTIHTVLRSHNEEEARLFEQQGMGTVFIGEQELAEGMSRHILAQCAVPAA